MLCNYFAVRLTGTVSKKVTYIESTYMFYLYVFSTLNRKEFDYQQLSHVINYTTNFSI